MPHTELRERLVGMRAGLLAGMDGQIEAGSLILLALADGDVTMC